MKSLFIPNAFVDVVFQLFHDSTSSGHPDRDRTLAAARGKYYWPTMRIDIQKHIAQRISCDQKKGSTQTAPCLDYPLPDGSFDVVGIDLLQLPRRSQDSVYILVCVDHFSRFVVLAPLPNKSAVTLNRHLSLKSCIEFLGHAVDGEGIHTVDTKINAMLLVALWNVLTEKYLRFCATLQETCMKPI